ncbi:MAG: oligosaccharide flippase family protein, partial [Promethearchaeota archaeon]
IFTSIISAIILFYLTKKIIGNFSFSFNKFYLKDAFSYGSKIYIGNLIIFFHYRIDLFLINKFLSPLAVGFYGLAVGLAERIWLISNSVGLVLFPKVSSEKNKKRLKEFTPLVFRNVMFVTSLIAFLLYFISKPLITFFYSEEFFNSILPFKILLIGIVSMSGWRILANDIYGRGRPELNIYVSFVSTILNIFLNIIWIPKYGISGAALATSISYFSSFILIIIVYCKISGNSIFDTIIMKKSDLLFYRGLIRSMVYYFKPIT